MKTGTPRRSGTAIGTDVCVYLMPRFFMLRFRVMRKRKTGTPILSGLMHESGTPILSGTANSHYEKVKPVHRGTRGLPSRIESSVVRLTLQVTPSASSSTFILGYNIVDHHLRFERFGFQFFTFGTYEICFLFLRLSRFKFFGSVKYCVSDDGLLFDSAAVRTPASWLARAKLEIVKHTKNR